MFLSKIVVKSFVFIFFNSILTRHMLNSLTSESIILIATMIQHTIEKFQHDSRTSIKFKDQVIESIEPCIFFSIQVRLNYANMLSTESYIKIKELWYSQRTDWQECVKTMLWDEIILITDTWQDDDEELIDFAFKDSLDDLDSNKSDSDYSLQKQEQNKGCTLLENTSHLSSDRQNMYDIKISSVIYDLLL